MYFKVIIVFSVLLCTVASLGPASQVFDIGARREGDQYILSDCRITNRTKETGLHKINFYNPNIIISYAKLDISPTWDSVSYGNLNYYMDIDVETENVNQVHVTLEVYGFLKNKARSMPMISYEEYMARTVIHNPDRNHIEETDNMP